MKRQAPGSRWRTLAHDRGGDGRSIAVEYEGREGVVFDELVLWGDPDRTTGEDRLVLHLEQMDRRHWWMSLGDAYVWIHVPKSGPVEVSVRRGEYGPVCGRTEAPAAGKGPRG